MNRNFEDKIVLTSQHPQAFLVFTTDSSTEVYIDVSVGDAAGKLFINGWDISKKTTGSSFLINLLDTKDAPFMIYTDSVEQFDLNLSFISYSDITLEPSVYIEQVDVSIHNRPTIFSSQDLNSYTTYDPLVDDKASYLLLRTIPTYSGNIKLVADSSNNLYLDTFKVSDILSNKKYRKQGISSKSFLSGDIRKIFGSLPIGEIFNVGGEDTLNISSAKTDLKDQYNMTYTYGARLLKDELYDDDYSLLAPLWINTTIPSYFAIFRLDGVYNEETYEDDPDLSSLAVDFIRNGQLMKSWNLKDNSKIGEYLNNHLHELNNVESPVKLSLNDEDPNTWYGIAVDKGIITGRAEDPYFFEQKTHNFSDINAFVSQGFVRNNLLCPNIINMEFTFCDNDVEEYSMHRYFGLYLTENELYKISYYSDTIDGSVRILSLDGKDSNVFIDSSTVFSISTGNVRFTYTNRIFVLNDGENLNRISNVANINGDRTYVDEYVNKLGNNIFTTEVKKITPGSFVTFTINNLLNQGEHLRIINKTQNKIWEIYGIDSSICDDLYVSFNEPETGYPELYRTTFSTLGTIDDQLTSIRNAFNRFKDYESSQFSVGIKRGTTLSISIDNEDDDFLFQRIMSNTLSSAPDPSSSFSASANYEDITFYGILTPSASDFVQIPFDASFGPIDFELFGDRLSVTINIINTADYNVYSFDSSVVDDFSNFMLYQSTNGYNYLNSEFDISTNINYTSKYVYDPTSLSSKSIIITEHPIALVGNKWNAYNVFPLSISIMGINPVKDFDTTVYDSKSEGMDFKSIYWYKRENDASTFETFLSSGEQIIIDAPCTYQIISGSGLIIFDSSIASYNVTAPDIFYFNTYFNDATIISITDTRITYSVLDGSRNYTSYSNNISEEAIDDYYANESKRQLKYGLVVPTISKWGLNGTDNRGNRLRLNLTADFFEDSSTINTNFITHSSFYPGEISYPVFKYMDPGEKNWQEYIYYDIYDVIEFNGELKSIKDLMIEEPSIDVFSKIVYSNNNVNDRISRSSILYYNSYNEKLTTISKGLKLSFEISDVARKVFNTKKWNKYRFSFITTPSVNRENLQPIEVFINEVNKTILMVWYQGNDVLNYSKRFSELTCGKNTLLDLMSTGNPNYYGIPVNDASYSYIKAPYRVNTASTIPSISNVYGLLTDYDSSVSNNFAQLNYNTQDNINSVFMAPGENYVVSSSFIFSNSLDTFNQISVNYTYVPSGTSYGTNIVNYPFSYFNNFNYYKDKTCELTYLRTLLNRNDIQYYIINEEQILTNTNFSVPPILTNVNSPILYKSEDSSSSIYTYNGFYRPTFKDILNFSSNEDYQFMNVVERDFIMSNTNLTSYNNISQYWFNKVVDEPRDSSNNIAFTKDFSPFKSSWDGDYYAIFEYFNVTYVDGYESNEEIPSFFGSKLISLPDQLVLNKWTANNTSITTLTSDYILEYNITTAIIDFFTGKPAFIENWSTIPDVDDSNINEYIIKTILDYYNISLSKLLVDVKYKSSTSNILSLQGDTTFNKTLTNISSELIYENNEYIYKIRVPISANRSYYTTITFNKK